MGTLLHTDGTPTRLLLVGLLLTAAVGLIAVSPGVHAQTTPTGTTSGEINENQTTTTTESHSWGQGNNSSGGFGAFVPNIDIPGPWEWVKGAIRGFVHGVTDGVSSFIEKFNSIFFGIPAPGSATNIGSWTNPSDGNWGGVWKMYWLNASIMFTFLVIANMWSFSNNDRAMQRDLFRKSIRGMFHILLGFIYLAALLHIGDIMATSFAPDGDQLLSTPGNIAKLGLGVVFGGLILLFKSGVVAVAVFIIILFYFTVLVLVAFWPWFITFRLLPIPAFGSFGSLGVTALPSIVVLRVFQAACLQLLHLVTWDITKGAAFIMALVGTAVGLLVVFVVLPMVGYRKVLPSAMMMTKPVKAKADKAGDKGRESMKEKAKEIYDQSRFGDGPTTKKEPTGTHGSTVSKNPDGTDPWEKGHQQSSNGRTASTPTTEKRPATDGGLPLKWDFKRKQQAKDILAKYERDSNDK